MFDNEQDRVHVDEGWLIYMLTALMTHLWHRTGCNCRHRKIAENIIWKDDDPALISSYCWMRTWKYLQST